MKLGHTQDSLVVSRKHVIAVERKYEKIQGLAALLETHENVKKPDHAYVLELRAKLRAAKQQLTAMNAE